MNRKHDAEREARDQAGVGDERNGRKEKGTVTPAAGVPVLNQKMAQGLLDDPYRCNLVLKDSERAALEAISTGRAVVVPAPAAPMTEKNQGGSWPLLTPYPIILVSLPQVPK